MQARTPSPGVKREGRKEKMWKKAKGGGENHWGSFSSKFTFVPTTTLMLREWKEGSLLGLGCNRKWEVAEVSQGALILGREPAKAPQRDWAGKSGLGYKTLGFTELREFV